MEQEQVTKELLAEMYYDRGMSQRDIAKELGCSQSKIKRLMRKFNLKARNKRHTLASRFVTVEEIMQLYINEKKSIREISNIKGISEASIRNFMKENNIPIREQSEAVKLWHQKERIVNVDFFKKMSPELAYILGLWASDGVVFDRGSFALGMKDKDVIDWVAEKISYTGTLHETDHKFSTRYIIQFTAPELLPVFEKYHITPRKSLTLKFPDLPTEMIPHFIRGVFDGDGSISKDKYSYRFNIVSGSKVFIEAIKNVIEAQIGGNRPIHFDSRGNGLYIYHVFGKEALYKLGKWLYQNDSFGMKRKKEKFNQLFLEYEQSLKQKDAV